MVAGAAIEKMSDPRIMHKWHLGLASSAVIFKAAAIFFDCVDKIIDKSLLFGKLLYISIFTIVFKSM